jgi:hypothetical protein
MGLSYKNILQKNITNYEYELNSENNNSNNNVIAIIINYIKNLNNINPIEIIDGENLIGGPIKHRFAKVQRIFSNYNDKSKIVILVVKKSGGTRRFKNYTGIDVPDHFIFISLHGDNKTCPDDAFILELANKYNNSIIISDDEYINRENFNYGNLEIGTKLTSNINIENRYIPDIHYINKLNQNYIIKKIRNNYKN